jgi:acylphosphatase
VFAAFAIASTSSAVMSVSSTSTRAMRPRYRAGSRLAAGGWHAVRVADERIRVRAHGRVQGVFFRDSVRREAARRGVAGWARNCADGSAEAVFEGPADAVAAMVEFVRRGPGHSSVSSVETVSEAPEGLSGFGVR